MTPPNTVTPNAQYYTGESLEMDLLLQKGRLLYPQPAIGLKKDYLVDGPAICA
jgi:hypothetical protein